MPKLQEGEQIMDGEKPSKERQVELAEEFFAGLYTAMRTAKKAGIDPGDIAFCMNAAGLSLAGGIIDLDRTLEEHIAWRKSKGAQL